MVLDRKRNRWNHSRSDGNSLIYDLDNYAQSSFRYSDAFPRLPSFLTGPYHFCHDNENLISEDESSHNMPLLSGTRNIPQ